MEGDVGIECIPEQFTGEGFLCGRMRVKGGDHRRVGFTETHTPKFQVRRPPRGMFFTWGISGFGILFASALNISCTQSSQPCSSTTADFTDRCRRTRKPWVGVEGGHRDQPFGQWSQSRIGRGGHFPDTPFGPYRRPLRRRTNPFGTCFAHKWGEHFVYTSRLGRDVVNRNDGDIVAVGQEVEMGRGR